MSQASAASAAPAQAPQENKTPISKYIHMIIGLAIIFFGRYLPSPTIVAPASERLINMGFPQVDGGVLLSLSPVGMLTITIFIGVIYLWGTVDTLWPCFIGVLALGFSSYAPMPKVLNTYMGTPMMVMMFFLLIFAAAMIKSGLAPWCAKWMMMKDFAKGRPWLFTFVILFSAYTAAMLEQSSAAFVLWPFLYTICAQVGYKRGDKYMTIMTVYIMLMCLLSFATDPFKSGAFYLINNLYTLSANNPALNAPVLNIAAYLFFGFVISMCSIAVLMFMMRFVFRVDVAPLATIDPAALREKEALPPMNRQQKFILLFFFIYAAWMLLPGLIGKSNIVGQFLSENVLAGSIVAVLLMSWITINGKPVADIAKVSDAYPWRIYFLVITAFLLGGAMTIKETNFAVFMEFVLKSFLDGLGLIPLTIIVVLLGLIFTNFCNSVVLGLIITPVILTICNAFGFAAGPLMACFIFMVLIAACTPAASPFAAMLYGNENITPKDIMVYAVSGSFAIFLVVVVIGIPLSRILF